MNDTKPPLSLGNRSAIEAEIERHRFNQAAPADAEPVILGKLLNAAIEQVFIMRLKWLESLAAAYVAYTGVKPADVELVEERRARETVWYFRRRTDQ